MTEEKAKNPTETSAPDKEEKTPVVKSKGKKKTRRTVQTGRCYVKATYNNTLVNFTDEQGASLVQYSAGRAGFKGPKKSTPYAAGVIVAKAAELVKDYGLKEVNVFVKGVGGGREASIRALNANGINVLGIKDVTPIPHNGCRPKKPRRV